MQRCSTTLCGTLPISTTDLIASHSPHPKTFFCTRDKPTENLDSSRIFPAVESDLILEMGDRSHPKTAQIWDIFACDRIPRNLIERGCWNVSEFCSIDPLKPREGVGSRMLWSNACIATAKAIRTHSAKHSQWHLVNNQTAPVVCGFDSSTKTNIAQSC